jgi:hypothetical protein
MMDYETFVIEGYGYMVFLALNYAAAGIELGAGSVIGMDLQLNDNAEGFERTACISWSDYMDAGWRDPGVWGEVTLLAGGFTTGAPVRIPPPPAPADPVSTAGAIDDAMGGGELADADLPGDPNAGSAPTGDSLMIVILFAFAAAAAFVTVRKIRVR